MTVGDDPDRDPLADARATLAALRAAPTAEHVAALLTLIDDEHAQAVLLAVGLDGLEDEMALDLFADGEGPPLSALPQDPWPDWLDRGRGLFDLLADMPVLELFRALRTLRSRALREIVTVLVLDRMNDQPEQE